MTLPPSSWDRPSRRQIIGVAAGAAVTGLALTAAPAVAKDHEPHGSGRRGPNPYEDFPDVPKLVVTSTDIRTNRPLPLAQLSGIFGAGGQDRSPQLQWSGAPSTTASYAVTVYDIDAPTGSGFWHWCVIDIPVAVTELAAGAGDPGSPAIPAGATTIPNDARLTRFIGAAPPPGTGRHHYWFVVHAVDVPTLGVDPAGTPALVGFNLFSHTVARGSLVPYAEG